MQPTWSLFTPPSMRLSAIAGCHSGSALKSRLRAHTASALASATPETSMRTMHGHSPLRGAGQTLDLAGIEPDLAQPLIDLRGLGAEAQRRVHDPIGEAAAAAVAAATTAAGSAAPRRQNSAIMSTRMRSSVISALSRPRLTSSRSVVMFTGITSCTIGSTKAPPSRTTFCPPRPVRTKARSWLLRSYSQCSNQTPAATTIAATIRARMKLPNSAPVVRVLQAAQDVGAGRRRASATWNTERMCIVGDAGGPEKASQRSSVGT